MPLSGLDPSMLIGFVARDETEWIELRRRIGQLPRTVFAVQDEPPTWPGADDDDDDGIGLESISDPEEAGLDDATRGSTPSRRCPRARARAGIAGNGARCPCRPCIIVPRVWRGGCGCGSGQGCSVLVGAAAERDGVAACRRGWTADAHRAGARCVFTEAAPADALTGDSHFVFLLFLPRIRPLLLPRVHILSHPYFPSPCISVLHISSALNLVHAFSLFISLSFVHARLRPTISAYSHMHIPDIRNFPLYTMF
ncbi:hypothetical protein C8R44DRAFT_818952 [Mycena epipterygia]|nr:hypothetical protein C8R44DRAFT_818952 [Mycena epipterygia]